MMQRRRRERQSGQAIVIVGAMFIILTILGTMVFDVGLAMSERRNLQAYADAAALAGSRSFGPAGPARANYVALQYLAPSLGFTVPVGACGGPTLCPAGTYYVAGYTIQVADSYRAGGILNYPSVLDVLLQHQQPSIFARMVGYSMVNTGASARATKAGPEYNGANYAVAALSGDALINGGGAAFQTVTGPVYAYGSFGANNGPHSTGVPSQQTDQNGHACMPVITNQIDNGGGSNGLNYHTTDGNPLNTNPNVAPPYNYDRASPQVAPPAPHYYTAAAAQDASGNWKPGIYDGFAPSGGFMNGGVYKIINSPSLALGAITNTVHQPSGTSNGADAVAIVLDSSDTGALDLSQAVLNGLDDLNNTGPSDPAGTHNFVVFGGDGPAGYTGGVTIGPGAGTDMSGIIYLPQSAYVSDGNSSPQFTGSLIVATMTVHGGGNGAQVFRWVCGLGAVAGKPWQGGLLR